MITYPYGATRTCTYDLAGNLLRCVYSGGPDLAFSYDPQTTQFYYHFDQGGNTLFLSDAAGTVTDTYAYTPFGRLLEHAGTNPQPFTFVGQWGVRQEGAGGELYQMGARFYDARTAAFLSRDPVWPEPREPYTMNPYQYALGNPLRYADPQGLFAGEFVQLAQGFSDFLGIFNSSLGFPSLREVHAKELKFMEPYKKNVAWLESLSLLTGDSKIAEVLGIGRLLRGCVFVPVFQKFFPPGLIKAKVIGQPGKIRVLLPKHAGWTIKGMKWLSRIGTGATLIGGLISWIEVLHWGFFTSNEENAAQVKRDMESGNPVTRFLSWVGRKVGDALFLSERSTGSGTPPPMKDHRPPGHYPGAYGLGGATITGRGQTLPQ